WFQGAIPNKRNKPDTKGSASYRLSWRNCLHRCRPRPLEMLGPEQRATDLVSKQQGMSRPPATAPHLCQSAACLIFDRVAAVWRPLGVLGPEQRATDLASKQQGMSRPSATAPHLCRSAACLIFDRVAAVWTHRTLLVTG